MARLAASLSRPRRKPRSRHGYHHGRREWRERREKLGKALLIALLAVAAFLAGLAWNSPHASGQALPATPGSSPGQVDRETARFVACGAAARVSCVVDGDTFWYRAAKIRLADINTPEVTRPACPREAALGEAASARLAELLNRGPFTLARAPDGRDRDRYGRLLRTVTRGGESLGDTLVREGLAEQWSGRRGSWC